MSNTKNTGGAAFPAWDMTFNQKPDLFSAGTSEGMTLRDYFAAKAMPIAMKQALSAIEDEDSADAMNLVPRLAYAMADAMLKARDQ